MFMVSRVAVTVWLQKPPQQTHTQWLKLQPQMIIHLTVDSNKVNIQRFAKFLHQKPKTEAVIVQSYCTIHIFQFLVCDPRTSQIAV